LSYIFQFFINFYFWGDSLEAEQDRSRRSEFGLAAFDQSLWGLAQTLPNIMFLFYFYLFMLDIVNYYEADPGKANGWYQPFLLSTTTDYIEQTLANFNTWLNTAF